MGTLPGATGSLRPEGWAGFSGNGKRVPGGVSSISSLDGGPGWRPQTLSLCPGQGRTLGEVTVVSPDCSGGFIVQ